MLRSLFGEFSWYPYFVGRLLSLEVLFSRRFCAIPSIGKFLHWVGRRGDKAAAAASLAFPVEWLAGVDSCVWVAFAMGVVPLVGVALPVWWHFHLARSVDMATHPFVRFPWWVAVSVTVAAALRGDSPAWYVAVAYGGIFVGTHVTYYARRVHGFDPPPLPWEYNFSGWPGAIVLGWAALSAGAYTFGLTEGTWAAPLGILRAFQATYGGYYLACYLVYRRDELLRLSLWRGSTPQVGMLGAVWKDLGEGGRAAAIGAAGVAGAATVGGAFHYRAEIKKLKVEESKVKVEESKVKVEESKVKLEQDKLDFAKQTHADERQDRFFREGVFHTRQGNQLDAFEVQPSSWRPWVAPRRWYTPPAPLIQPMKPTVSAVRSVEPPIPPMTSPLEEFVVLPGVVAFLAGPDFSAVVVALVVGVLARRAALVVGRACRGTTEG